MKCKNCKKEKEEKYFGKDINGGKRNICKDCARTTQVYYTHPESFYNLFVGKDSWKHLYFGKTIGKQW